MFLGSSLLVGLGLTGCFGKIFQYNIDELYLRLYAVFSIARMCQVTINFRIQINTPFKQNPKVVRVCVLLRVAAVLVTS